MTENRKLRLVLDGAICLPDSFKFTIYHCMKLKAFRHERASLNRIAADKSHGVIVALVRQNMYKMLGKFPNYLKGGSLDFEVSRHVKTRIAITQKLFVKG